MARVKEESWDLNSNDTTAIPSGNRADGTASVWSDIYKYQVPTGQAHILKPSHHFSAYFDTSTGSSESAIGTTRVRIQIRDQSEEDSKSVYGPALYITCRDFDDVTKMAMLNLKSDLAVEERFFIVIQAYGAAAIKHAYSYFNLETIRVRSGI